VTYSIQRAGAAAPRRGPALPTLALAAVVAALLNAAAPTAQAQAQTQNPAAPAAPAKSPKLDRAAVDALLERPGNVLFVDVRRPDELTSIGGFPVYLSVQSAEVESRLDLIPRERTIVTVSNHAARALKAADLLAAHGFHVAGAVGIQDYVAQGGTVLRIAVPTPQAATAAPAAH
jgi:rhodanese-related sulfurtransferase